MIQQPVISKYLLTIYMLYIKIVKIYTARFLSIRFLMTNTTVLHIKEYFQHIRRKRVVSFETRKKCEITITVLFQALFVSGILILFIMGGGIYTEEHPKELTYLEDICQVLNTSYREYWCVSGKTGRRRCYAPIWDVIYGENQTINATIVGYNRFREMADTIKKMHEYQVS